MPAPPTHITAPPICTSLSGLGAQPGRFSASPGNGFLLSEPSTSPVKASTGMAMNSRKIRDGRSFHLIGSRPISGRK